MSSNIALMLPPNSVTEEMMMTAISPTSSAADAGRLAPVRVAQ
jgi:hypothetical protein